MKKFWQKEKTMSTPHLLMLVVILIQLLLLVILMAKVTSLRSDFLEYREASMKRINQTYGQIYSISNRLNNR